MPLARKAFGRTPDGSVVEALTLSNTSADVSVTLITYGARMIELVLPDREGTCGNVVLGFDRLEPYLGDTNYFGPIVGRYANRIAGGRFELDGVTFNLPLNDPAGPNTLHGGPKGFDKQIWQARALAWGAYPRVVLTYESPDMDDGFPGRCGVSATYTLGEDELRIDYAATCDRDTIINLSQHVYFNLRGAGDGNVLNHLLSLSAGRYTPVDRHKIPTGAIERVEGTPLDFTAPSPIGRQIAALPGGYDHNFVLDADRGYALRLCDPQSGRELEIATDQPGLQLYSGDGLDGSIHGRGGAYPKYAGVVMEPQHFPDSVHHPDFPSTLLRTGQTFSRSITYRFSTG